MLGTLMRLSQSTKTNTMKANEQSAEKFAWPKALANTTLIEDA